MVMKSKVKGFAKVKECKARFAMGESTWWAKVKLGMLPKGLKMSKGTTVWALSDLDDLEALVKAGLGWGDRKAFFNE